MSGSTASPKCQSSQRRDPNQERQPCAWRFAFFTRWLKRLRESARCATSPRVVEDLNPTSAKRPRQGEDRLQPRMPAQHVVLSSSSAAAHNSASPIPDRRLSRFPVCFIDEALPREVWRREAPALIVPKQRRRPSETRQIGRVATCWCLRCASTPHSGQPGREQPRSPWISGIEPSATANTFTSDRDLAQACGIPFDRPTPAGSASHTVKLAAPTVQVAIPVPPPDPQPPNSRRTARAMNAGPLFNEAD